MGFVIYAATPSHRLRGSDSYDVATPVTLIVAALHCLGASLIVFW